MHQNIALSTELSVVAKIVLRHWGHVWLSAHVKVKTHSVPRIVQQNIAFQQIQLKQFYSNGPNVSRRPNVDAPPSLTSFSRDDFLVVPITNK